MATRGARAGASEPSGAFSRALVGAGALGSRRPLWAGIGLGFVAALSTVLVAARSPDVVGAIEAAEGPPGAVSIAGEPLSPGATTAPTASAAKRAFATPDELDAADTLEKLIALGETYPDDPALVKRLAIAHAGKNDHSGAIRAVRKLARLSPTTVGEDAIQQVVVRAANGPPDVMELAFELMREGMGAVGPDLLFTIATTASTSKSPKERADRALGEEKVRSAATPALLIAIELRATKNSCDRKKLFPRARDEGDERSLPFLTPLLASDGCGFLGTGDCLKCLGGRQDLREAITAIQSRKGGK